MAVSQNGILALSILTAVMSTVLVLVSLSTTHWESHTFDSDCVLSKNGSHSVITKHADYFSLTLLSNFTEPEDGLGLNVESRTEAQVYPVYDKYAGVWTICDMLSGK